MHFNVYGILETDRESRRILSFFPAEVSVQVDEDRGLLRLEPVAGPGRIPLPEQVDDPELPLREGGMTIRGHYVHLVFLGRSSGDGSLGEGDSLVYALKDAEEAERLRQAIGGHG